MQHASTHSGMHASDPDDAAAAAAAAAAADIEVEKVISCAI
jgi:hypothetical protein